MLVYFPIYDLWSQPGRSMLVHFNAGAPRIIAGIGQKLLQKGYTFDFVSDRQLNNIKFRNNSLQAGNVHYKAIVVPECTLMPLKTLENLTELAQQGATIIFENSLPSDVPGWNKIEERRKNFQNTAADINFINADEYDLQKADFGNGKVLLGSDIEKLLSYAEIERETIVDYGLRFIRRDLGDSKCYFIVNNSRNNIEGWIPVREQIKSAVIFEPIQGVSGIAAIRTSKDNNSEVYIQLSPGESCILKIFQKEVEGTKYQYIKTVGQPQEISGTWTIDFIEGGPELPKPIKTQQLTSWTNYEAQALKIFSGTASYSISFQKPETDSDGFILDLGRVCESAQVILNGKNLGTFIGPIFRIHIPNDIIHQKNNLEIIVSNLMLNRIIDLDKQNINWKKFYNTNFPSRTRQARGTDGQFNASNLSPVDSGLIGPVTIESIEHI